ncbi:MAG: SIS domain-containing protein [bacterium]
MEHTIENAARRIVGESIKVHQDILDGSMDPLAAATEMLVRALKQGNKVLFFGNGGSAADAQHLAAELVNRFLFDRPALPGIALTTDTSVLTSIANDSDYTMIFSRQVEALGREGDVAFGITTSGSSGNVLAGLKKARERGMGTIALIGGRNVESLRDSVDVVISVPSTSTPRIQEAHIMIGHILCELVEEQMFSNFREGC